VFTPEVHATEKGNKSTKKNGNLAKNKIRKDIYTSWDSIGEKKDAREQQLIRQRARSSPDEEKYAIKRYGWYTSARYLGMSDVKGEAPRTDGERKDAQRRSALPYHL